MPAASENSTKKRSRSDTPINSKLEHRLLGYVTAASAVGISLMAAAPPAEAKIVYTPLNNVPLSSLGNVDLNGDGVTDLTFKFYETGYGAAQQVYAAPGNGLIFGTLNHESGPLPLPWLTRIGPAQQFSGNVGDITGVDGCHSTCNKFGVWLHQTNKFLGIKFLIAGQVHYGWMRLTVNGPLSGYASGYAYEDVPNKPILAGKMTGPVESASAVPVAASSGPRQSLGALARGADGVAGWRKDERASEL
ncbi:MAG TPA: hypothetical protein VI386_21765 [Candidatus Sulfotelmatobacter sp.]